MKNLFQRTRKIENYKLIKIVGILIILISYKIFQEKKIIKTLIRFKNFLFNSKLSIRSINDINTYFFNQQNKTLVFLEGKQYIDNCINTINFSKINNIKIKPVISVIIPVYNCEKTIYSSICSVQNQNYTDYEIILIEDNSNDKSFEIIQSLRERDSRIYIFRNKKNMGTLYSRSIGVLMSKGEYIFALDNDDLFFVKDIFDFILNIAKKYDFDVVGFRGIRTGNYRNDIEKMSDLYNYKRYNNNIIVHQPYLSTWMVLVNGNYHPHDMTIWAKCIKSKVYKEATFKLGVKRYSAFISWCEDTIVNFIIFTIAQSFAFIHKYGIIHLHNTSTASYYLGKDKRIHGDITLIDIIYDFTPNNSEKNLAILGLYHYKKMYNINNFVNNKNIIYLKSVLIKFLNSKFISKENKNKIKKDFKSFFI